LVGHFPLDYLDEHGSSSPGTPAPPALPWKVVSRPRPPSLQRASARSRGHLAANPSLVATRPQVAKPRVSTREGSRSLTARCGGSPPPACADEIGRAHV